MPNLRSYQDTPTKLSQFAHETLATTEKPNFNQIKKIKRQMPRIRISRASIAIDQHNSLWEQA